jgi:hypothetical protein
MAFTHGKNTAVLFKQFDLSGYFNSYDLGQMAETAETTTFGNAAKTYIVGQRDGTLSLVGLFDGAADAVDEELAATIAAATVPVITIGINGTTVGNAAKLALAHTTSYQVTGSVGDAVQVSGEFQATGGIDNGVFLHALGAETGTANGASVDNGASTANGWAANLHVTVDNVTSATIKVQHSTDNSSWADLGTFTAVSVVGSEQITGTGTVNRYTRCIVSAFTGTSATFAVALARR